MDASWSCNLEPVVAKEIGEGNDGEAAAIDHAGSMCDIDTGM
jgi:hypothetical protein